MNSPEDSRRAGRGLVSIAGAKVFFIITSYAVQISLPRIFGEVTEFGLYSAAMSGVAILNNVLIVATIQSVSKFVSEDETHADSTLRQGLRVQALVGGALSAALFVLAPAIARVLLDDQITPLIQVAAVAVFAYSLYAVVVGSLNGRHWFAKQARLDIVFSTLRTIGILSGAALGIGALGAVMGFAAASGLVLSIALIWIGWGRPGKSIPLGRWVGFMVPLWVYQLCLNGILMIDIQVLKRTATEIALAGSATSVAAADLANQYVGYYRAAQTFAFVPYQLILSLTFIIFPMISKATSLGDGEAARSTIQHAMRLALLALLLVAAPTSGAAEGVVRLAYPADYVAGGPALAILVFGVSAFALFVVSATAISGAGRPALAAAIAAGSLVAVVISTRLLIGRAGLGTETLAATATGTTIGMVIALVGSGLALYARFRVAIPIRTWARAAFAAAVGYVVAHAVPTESPLWAIAALGAGFVAVLTTLIVTGELSREDWSRLRAALARN